MNKYLGLGSGNFFFIFLAIPLMALISTLFWPVGATTEDNIEEEEDLDVREGGGETGKRYTDRT